MSTYVRYATRAYKHVIDLGQARDRKIIDTDMTAVTILDKGAGTFTLHFIFEGQAEFTLNQNEVSNGDTFRWDIIELRLTNTTQTGQTLKLIVEKQTK